MAKCEICGKVTRSGFSVSHSHHGTKRDWKPNLHRVKLLIEGRVRRVNVCTKCLRSDKIQKAI